MQFSRNIQDLVELSENYQEAPFLISMEKNNNLTIEEMMLVHRILIGCTKLAFQHDNKHKKFTKEDLVRISVSKLIHSKILSDTEFRPSNIKEKMSEVLKNLSRNSDISKILSAYTNTNYLTKVEFNNNKRRGRPSQKTDSEISGPKSFYKESERHRKLKKLISKPMARYLIYSHLIESNVIQNYIKKICLEILNLLNNNNMNKKEINKYAKSMTDEILEKTNWKESNFLYDNFYIFGGISYYY